MSDAPDSRGQTFPWVGWFVGPAFLLLSAGLILGPETTLPPGAPSASIDPAALSIRPRREALDDPPTIQIDGFRRTCMSCHRMFPPREVAPGKLLQHRHVLLDHGINNRCHNCHDDDDRNRLVLRDGGTITYARAVELCAQCHGPTFRDWERGAHGRTQGYWDQTRGPQSRLGCTECHDPHHPRVPAMEPLAPLPGPRALRAPAEDTVAEHPVAASDPLRKHAALGHVDSLTGPDAAAEEAVEYYLEEDE